MLYYSVVHVTSVPIHLLPIVSISSPFMYYVDLIEQEVHLTSHLSLSKICFYSDLRKLGGDETLSVMANIINRV